MDAVTAPQTPPFRETDEATAAQLGRALDEGKAVSGELGWVEREEAASSGSVSAGEYLVTYLITPSDDYYDLEVATSDHPAHHTTVLPGSAHVAVVVRDAADGRIVQGLNVHATLRSESSSERRTVELPYGWHPILNRYGENVVLPASPFTLRVRIGMPSYSRHDSTNGNRFTGDVLARFAGISVSDDSLATASQRLARGESREATALARREGTAMDRPLRDLARRTDVSGSQIRSGDYEVAVVVQRARGYWEARDGKLRYRRADNNVGPIAHIDVSIRDATTGRFLPDLKVRATVLNSRNKEIDTYVLPFMWHPWMNHYGLDVAEPGPGRYAIRVRAEPPAFRRYGSTALRKFNQPINVLVRGLQFAAAVR